MYNEFISYVALTLLSKAFWLKLITGLLIFLFDGPKIAYQALAALIVLDLITGVWASKVQNIPILSRRMGYGSAKKVAVYAMALITANLSERALGLADQDLFLSVMLGILVLTEALSNIENLLKIYPESRALNQIKKLLNQEIDKRNPGG